MSALDEQLEYLEAASPFYRERIRGRRVLADHPVHHQAGAAREPAAPPAVRRAPVRAARGPRAPARDLGHDRRAGGDRAHAERPRGELGRRRRVVPDRRPAPRRHRRALPQLRALRGRHRRPHGDRGVRGDGRAGRRRPVAAAARADPAARHHRDLRHALVPRLPRREGPRGGARARRARPAPHRHRGRAGRGARRRPRRDRAGVGRQRHRHVRDERRVVDDGGRVRAGRRAAPDHRGPRRARGHRPGDRRRRSRSRTASRGELVWTHLNRRASPLLRYRSSDLATVYTAPCACGRTTPAHPHRRPPRRHAARPGGERLPAGDRASCSAARRTPSSPTATRSCRRCTSTSRAPRTPTACARSLRTDVARASRSPPATSPSPSTRPRASSAPPAGTRCPTPSDDTGRDHDRDHRGARQRARDPLGQPAPPQRLGRRDDRRDRRRARRGRERPRRPLPRRARRRRGLLAPATTCSRPPRPTPRASPPRSTSSSASRASCSTPPCP